MNRTEIEIKLNKDRAWLLNTYANLPEADLLRDATPSEHDPATSWSAKDHLAHLAGIEKNFVRIIQRHIAGDAEAVGLAKGADGQPRTRDQVMASVHEMTEQWVREQRTKSLSEVVALGQAARAETLALLAALRDDQLLEKVPGAPWADGTVGSMLALHADHGRMHWKWASEGLALKAS